MNSTKDKLENETPHFGNTLLGAVPSDVFNEDCITVMKRYPDKFFDLAVFDPPHFATLGKTSRTAKMYGKLFPSWEDDIANGFKECFRVLKPKGTLIFKWNSTEIPLSKVLELAVVKPLFGHTTGRQAKTHWVTFIKI